MEGRAVGQADGALTLRTGGRGTRGDLVARSSQGHAGRSISTSLTGEPVGRWRELADSALPPGHCGLAAGKAGPLVNHFEGEVVWPCWCLRADLTISRVDWALLEQAVWSLRPLRLWA